jgi:hypothetical protein
MYCHVELATDRASARCVFERCSLRMRWMILLTAGRFYRGRWQSIRARSPMQRCGTRRPKPTLILGPAMRTISSQAFIARASEGHGDRNGVDDAEFDVSFPTE